MRKCKRCGKLFPYVMGDVIVPFDIGNSSPYYSACREKIAEERRRMKQAQQSQNYETKRKETEMSDNSIFEAMATEVNNAEIPENVKQKLLSNIARLQKQKLNLMITGATGCGKSSTINAIFDANTAKVGVGVDPETQSIEKYEYGNLIIWDTPGLGDGKEADERHARNIRSKLQEKDGDGNALIDLVLVILDGSSRDLGTSYDLINRIIIPNLGENNADREKRILVAINQCDIAMKGRHWNYEENCPEQPLVDFLEEKVRSVQKRIYEGTGVNIEPIYYSAGYTDGESKQYPYNVSKLLYYIIRHTPDEKRMIYADHLAKDKNNFAHDDKKDDYNKKSWEDIMESVCEGAAKGADIGEKIGGIFGGEIGAKAGRAVGGVVGGVVGFVRSLPKPRRWW